MFWFFFCLIYTNILDTFVLLPWIAVTNFLKVGWLKTNLLSHASGSEV